MTKLTAAMRRAKKAHAAALALVGTWCATVLPTHHISKWDLAGLGLALAGGPVVYKLTNNPPAS